MAELGVPRGTSGLCKAREGRGSSSELITGRRSLEAPEKQPVFPRRSAGLGTGLSPTGGHPSSGSVKHESSGRGSIPGSQRSRTQMGPSQMPGNPADSGKEGSLQNAFGRWPDHCAPCFPRTS